MNKYKLHETAAIFFLADIYLTQGISSVYVLVDFIRMGLLELWGSRVLRELQNEKIPAHSGIRTRYIPPMKRTR